MNASKHLVSIITHVAKGGRFQCKYLTGNRAKLFSIKREIWPFQAAGMIGTSETRPEEIIRREIMNEEKTKVYKVVLTGGKLTLLNVLLNISR